MGEFCKCDFVTRPCKVDAKLAAPLKHQPQSHDDGETVEAACSALRALFKTREAEAAKLTEEESEEKGGFLANISFPFRQNKSTSPSRENVHPASIGVDEAKLQGLDSIKTDCDSTFIL